jgi:hypothetical protein
MKSRRRSRAAKGRKRDAKGHFVKASSAQAPRRRKRRARAAAPAVSSPKRRRRARRRNPWYGQPRRHAKAARKGWRHRRRGKARRARSHAAPIRRRRRRSRAIIARGVGRARRSGSRRSTPINIKVSLAPKRRSSHRKARRSHTKRRSSARRHRHSQYTPASHQLAAEGYALSNPLSGGELVLVGITGLVGFGLADFVGRYMETTAVASGAAANSIPAGATVPNDVATTAFPSWQAMAAQFGIAAVPGIAAAFVDSPWGRAALQGMMLGAGFSLFGGLFKSLMASMIGTTALGQQLYLAETEAQAAVTAAGGTTAAATSTTTPTATATGVQGLPRGVGRRMIPAGRGVGQSQVSSVVIPKVQQPTAPRLFVPSGVPPYNPASSSGSQAMPAPPGIVTNTGDVVPSPAPGTPTPGGASTGPMCAPCTSMAGGIAGTHASAVSAIRDESCLGKLPNGMGLYASFPE